MTLFEVTALAALTLLGHVAPTHTDCWCDSARVQNGWCDPCEVGYIGGISIPYADVVEALDTHGHPVDVPSLECAGCRDAAARDGICKDCGWGVVDAHIYASKLTYYLALARHQETARDEAFATTDPDDSRDECAQCESFLPSDPPHWCDSCSRGTIATFVFREHVTYEAAVAELELLRRTLRQAPACQACAVAAYFGTSCPTHRR